MHEEALDVLPDSSLRRLAIDAPVLGHSDGASIALIHAAHHPVRGVVAIAPHVFVEELGLTEIRKPATPIRRAASNSGWPAITGPRRRLLRLERCWLTPPSPPGTFARRST